MRGKIHIITGSIGGIGMLDGKVVAGLMAISDFPLAPQMVEDLAKRCDILVLRFDALNGNKDLFKLCCAATGECEVLGLRGRERWNRWNWREQLVRSLDHIRPGYVLFPDSDETFGKEMDDDLDRFVRFGQDVMMFDYEMATDDDRAVLKYPKSRHCKAFRWTNKIGYRPYRGYAKPTWPDKECKMYMAKSKIRHYCFFNTAMEMEKLGNLHL